jgi:peptide-methionine (S)-S-oxide reductase
MHKVFKTSLYPPFPDGSMMVQFGMGCFWGAEQMFWRLPGVINTHVGYSGGRLANPTYRQVCFGNSEHAEVVRVVYDPNRIHFQDLLKVFWEGHDPTQGDRQGNDDGTQYRSTIYIYSQDQMALAERTKSVYQEALRKKGFGQITTEIRMAPEFYYAENEHQQFLHEHPNGYCGHGHTGADLDLAKL